MKNVLLAVIIYLGLLYTQSYSQILVDDFSNFDTSLYILYHDGYYSSYEDIRLTSSMGGGRIYLKEKYVMDKFDITFDFYMGGGYGSGADGIVFGFTTTHNYPFSSGEWLDFVGSNGYGIILNTYKNSSDPSEECIGIVKDGPTNYLSYWIAPDGALEGARWRNIRVLNDSGYVQVWLDDTLRINYTIPSYQPFEGYFGFTAAIAMYTNLHVIDNLIINSATRVSCCLGIRGNINNDELDQIDISDLVGLVAYMFQGGEEPPCFDEADIDGAGGIDISDLVGLVGYMFQGGAAPALCP